MTQFKKGDRVRVNEGLLEGKTGTVTDSTEHETRVKMDEVIYNVGQSLDFYTATLVSGGQPHAALAHLMNLYPDFLKAPKSDKYRFRLTTYLNGVTYVSYVLNAHALVETLKEDPPAGLSGVEFMLKQDDPKRGLAWKMLWPA